MSEAPGSNNSGLLHRVIKITPRVILYVRPVLASGRGGGMNRLSCRPRSNLKAPGGGKNVVAEQPSRQRMYLPKREKEAGKDSKISRRKKL